MFTIPEVEPGKLLIKETFFSIQAEGVFTGCPAFFIRFAGCDIGCRWCDSKDAWSVENSILYETSEILHEALSHQTSLVIITGGEPLIYDLAEITGALRNHGKKVHIETSGAYPLRGEFDWLTLSPKKVNMPDDQFYKLANELKIIVNDASDLVFAQNESKKVEPSCQLILQPQWNNQSEMVPEIMTFLKKNPQWRLSLQVHKYLGIP